MADLLECLAQIRALAETAPRLAALLRDADPALWAAKPTPAVWAPVEVLAHLADIEVIWAARVLGMLSVERPALQAVDPDELARCGRYLERSPAAELERFSHLRADTLAALGRCSAAQLERVGVHARRGAMTVADVVAGMLAHDTVHVGQIRQRLADAAAEGRTEG